MRLLSTFCLLILSSFALLATITQANAQPIRIGCPRAIPLYYLPVPVAENLGLFKKEGLTVEIVDIVGANAAKALLSNSIDVSCNSLDHAIKALAQGQSLKMIAGFQKLPGMALVVDKKHAGQIKNVADLKGRAIGIGVVGSSTHLGLQYVLKQAGIAERDVRVVSVPGAAFLAAIKSGQIDAGMNLEPFITRLLREDSASMLVDLRTATGTKQTIGTSEFVNTGVLVTEGTIKSKPELVQKFANAIVAANLWIQAKSPTEIADALPFLGDLKPDFIAAMGTLKDAYYPDAVPTVEGAKAVVDFHRQVGTIEPGFAVDPAALLDLSFVKRAAAR